MTELLLLIAALVLLGAAALTGASWWHAARARHFERLALSADDGDPVERVMFGSRLATTQCRRCGRRAYEGSDGEPIAHLGCEPAEEWQ